METNQEATQNVVVSQETVPASGAAQNTAVNQEAVSNSASTQTSSHASTSTNDVNENDRKTVLIEYILMGIAFFFPLTAIVSVIMAHIKRSDTVGTWLESHHRYLIRTFWFGLLGYIVGFVTSPIIVGYIILIITWLWTIYRVIKGFLAFNDKKPAYKNM